MKRILIIRPSSIGDIVMASPLLDALRGSDPAARISWLIEPRFADLLRAHPALDRLIPWPQSDVLGHLRKARMARAWRPMRELLRELRAAHFDLAIDAQGLTKTRVLAWLSRAPERIGLESGEPGASLLTRVVARDRSDPRMSSEYRALADELGLEPGEFAPRLELAPSDRQAAATLLRSRGIDRYVVLAPFTTRPQKHWLEEHWSELGRQIAGELDLDVVLCGRAQAAGLADALKRACGERFHDLNARTSLGEAAAVVASSAALVGVDTGLTHLGVAFQRPTVALFGATRPYLETANPRCTVLYRALDCSPCRRKPTCAGRYTCMREIGADDVLRALAAQLDQ